MLDIRPAEQFEIDRIIATATNPASREHHRERWARQTRGEGVYLLARQDGEWSATRCRRGTDRR